MCVCERVNVLLRPLQPPQVMACGSTPSALVLCKLTFFPTSPTDWDSFPTWLGYRIYWWKRLGCWGESVLTSFFKETLHTVFIFVCLFQSVWGGRVRLGADDGRNKERGSSDHPSKCEEIHDFSLPGSLPCLAAALCAFCAAGKDISLSCLTLLCRMYCIVVWPTLSERDIHQGNGGVRGGQSFRC